jgi:transposase
MPLQSTSEPGCSGGSGADRTAEPVRSFGTFTTDLHRLVDWFAECGVETVVGRVPQGHWKTITFVAALRRYGMRAPCTFDGSMTGAKFLAYIKQCLAPTLRRKDIVMIDNLSAHKAAGIREAIEARGATLRYLPQYSPDLNPIEMPFSKLKGYLRKAAERTIPRLRRRIGRFACTLTAREAGNYFRHAGYE